MDIAAWRHKLDELETALSRFPHVIDALGKPVTDRAIENAQHAVAPFRLPDWVCEMYRWHNGCDRIVGQLFELPFNSLEDATELYRGFTGMGDQFWYRPFTFPLCQVDKDALLITLDEEDGSEQENTILYFMYHEEPARYRDSPFEYVDGLIRKIGYLDEDSFEDDGWFTSFGHHFSEMRIPRVRSPYFHGGVSAERWTPAWRRRAGIHEFTVRPSELDKPPAKPPPIAYGEKWHPAHVGPWLTHVSFTDDPRQQQSPTAVAFRFGEFRLAEGTLSWRVLVAGQGLEALIWFDPATLADEAPVISRVAYPIAD